MFFVWIRRISRRPGKMGNKKEGGEEEREKEGKKREEGMERREGRKGQMDGEQMKEDEFFTNL